MTLKLTANLSVAPTNVDGTPMYAASEEKTFKDFAVGALLATYEGEELTFEGKMFRASLASRIKQNSDNVELTFGEAIVLINLITRVIKSPQLTQQFTDLFSAVAVS